MFTSKLPRRQMEEEHALELDRLEAGGKPWPELDLPVLRRWRIHIAVSIVVGITVVAFVVWAATFEQTAITAIPGVTRGVFVPLTIPAP